MIHYLRLQFAASNFINSLTIKFGSFKKKFYLRGVFVLPGCYPVCYPYIKKYANMLYNIQKYLHSITQMRIFIL